MLVASPLADVANADPLDTVGIRRMTVLAPERGMMLDVTVWYPAGAGGTAVSVGDNVVLTAARSTPASLIKRSWPATAYAAR